MDGDAQVSLYLTKYLIGHGYYRAYFYKYGFDTEEVCPECRKVIKCPLYNIVGLRAAFAAKKKRREQDYWKEIALLVKSPPLK